MDGHVRTFEMYIKVFWKVEIVEGLMLTEKVLIITFSLLSCLVTFTQLQCRLSD